MTPKQATMVLDVMRTHEWHRGEEGTWCQSCNGGYSIYSHSKHRTPSHKRGCKWARAVRLLEGLLAS